METAVGSRGSVIPYFKKLIREGANTLPITDPNKLGWINIQDSVKFVFDCFDRMIGGEIFIPKIPSIKVTELASAIAPNLEQKIIGIRPGEKLHEKMIGVDDAKNTYSFSDYYVIYQRLILEISILIRSKKQIF